MPELKWERIAKDSLGLPEVLRAKILGGWLVLTGFGITFVPDPEHRWDGGAMPA